MVGARQDRGEAPPAAKAGAWIALAVVVLPMLAVVVVALGSTDESDVGRVAGDVGGWLLLLGAFLALVFGAIGLAQSVATRSPAGIALSLAPLAVVALGLLLTFGG